LRRRPAELRQPFKKLNPRNTVCAAFTGPLAQVVIPRSPPASLFPVSLRSQFVKNATVCYGYHRQGPRSTCCGPGINKWDIEFAKKEHQIWRDRQMESSGPTFLNIWKPREVLHRGTAKFRNQGGTLARCCIVRDTRFAESREVNF